MRKIGYVFWDFWGDFRLKFLLYFNIGWGVLDLVWSFVLGFLFRVVL